MKKYALPTVALVSSVVVAFICILLDADLRNKSIFDGIRLFIPIIKFFGVNSWHFYQVKPSKIAGVLILVY